METGMHGKYIVNRVIKVWRGWGCGGVGGLRRKEAEKKNSKSPKLNYTVKLNYTRGLNLKIEDTVSPLQVRIIVPEQNNDLELLFGVLV